MICKTDTPNGTIESTQSGADHVPGSVDVHQVDPELQDKERPEGSIDQAGFGKTHSERSIPNLRCEGECYILSLTEFVSKLEKCDKPEKISFYIVNIDPNQQDIQLRIDNDSYQLICDGAKHGTYKFTLKLVAEQPGISESHLFPLLFYVNPNPKSLWQDIPADFNDEYYKPESYAAGIKVNQGKQVAAASKRGRSHAHKGGFREDDFSILFNEEHDFTILVVADGAGSAKFSRKGSSIAVQKIKDVLNQNLNKQFWYNMEKLVLAGDSAANQKIEAILYTELMVNAAFAAQKAIADECERANLDKTNQDAENVGEESDQRVLKDYSTTLLFSVLKHIPCGWFIASFGIGDGGIGILDIPNEKVLLHTCPDIGTSAGQTRFITMKSVWMGSYEELVGNRIHYSLVKDFDCLALMTDGITDAWFETESNLSDYQVWKHFWADLTMQVDLTATEDVAAQELLKWLDFWSPGNYDDRTIVLFY